MLRIFGCASAAMALASFRNRNRARSSDANSCVSATTFYNNYVTMVKAVLAAGKIPVVPTIPWARTANIQNCGTGFVAKIQALYAAYPEIVPRTPPAPTIGTDQKLRGWLGSAARNGAHRGSVRASSTITA